MKNKGITMRTGDLKGCAMSALEYHIEHLLKQYEIRFNLQVTGVQLTAKGVQISWQETAKGIRTQEEAQQEYTRQVTAGLQSIIDKVKKQQ